MAESIDQRFPHLSEFVMTHGWIEIGQDDFSRSFVRALDIGGMLWEGRETYATLDEALRELDTALKEWMEENL